MEIKIKISKYFLKHQMDQGNISSLARNELLIIKINDKCLFMFQLITRKLKNCSKRWRETQTWGKILRTVRGEVRVLGLRVVALVQKGLSTIHNNPWELRINPSSAVRALADREFLSRSWIRADCGSVAPHHSSYRAVRVTDQGTHVTMSVTRATP